MNPRRTTALVLWLLLSFLSAAVFADFKPVSVHVKDQSYWVGQRIPFFVELRAKGSFAGAVSCSLPKIPRAVILKIGNPVVSSEEDGGASVFVQTHEFALFSQQSGTVEVPAFEVRFQHHEGFTGPVKDEVAQVPAARVEVKRPAGSDDNAFLVTTSSLKVSESWQPQPGSTQPGAIFHRTISQEADDISGMALAPPPESVPDGVRIYVDPPTVTDNTERGAFRGRRIDRITYAMQSPGAWTLPAIQYVWWDPAKQQFSSKTLPAATFAVTAPPTPEAAEKTSTQPRRWGMWLMLGLVLTALAVWQRQRIMHGVQQAWRSWNPPERVAARKLLQACRRNDPKAAAAAWLEWEKRQAADFQPLQSLRAAAMDLQSSLYGRQRLGAWCGAQLARAFREQRATASSSSPSRLAELPELNPASDIL